MLFIIQLYNRVDPSVNNNWCLRLASMQGYHKIVKYLLAHPKSDPTIMNQTCIRLAASFGHHKVVRELMKDHRVDPTVYDFEVVKSARYIHISIFNI